MTVINHDMNYVGWVQRSLNRITGAGLRTDGLITQLYRMWVMEFQYGTGCLTRDGSVDRTTQDAIIKNNLCGITNGSEIYIQWVQQALAKASVAFSNVLPTGHLDKATKEAVMKFQESVKHKHIDGVVGPKTELDLIRKVPDLVVPGYYPGHSMPFPDPVEDRKDDTLEHNDPRGIEQRIDNWTNVFLEKLRISPGSIPDPVRREGTKCMIRKIQMGTYDYEYLDIAGAKKVGQGHGEKGKTKEELDLPYDLPESEYKLDRPVSDFTLDARQRLRYKVGQFSNHMESKALFKHYQKAVEELYKEIDQGIKHVKYQLHNSGVTVGSYKKLDEWYKSKIGDSKSIVSCILDPSGNPYLGGRTGY